MNEGQNPSKLFWVCVTVRVIPVARKSKKQRPQLLKCVLDSGHKEYGFCCLITVHNTIKNNVLGF
jgi:hypothetical protein